MTTQFCKYINEMLIGTFLYEFTDYCHIPILHNFLFLKRYTGACFVLFFKTTIHRTPNQLTPPILISPLVSFQYPCPFLKSSQRINLAHVYVRDWESDHKHWAKMLGGGCKMSITFLTRSMHAIFNLVVCDLTS